MHIAASNNFHFHTASELLIFLTLGVNWTQVVSTGPLSVMTFTKMEFVMSKIIFLKVNVGYHYFLIK